MTGRRDKRERKVSCRRTDGQLPAPGDTRDTKSSSVDWARSWTQRPDVQGGPGLTGVGKAPPVPVGLCSLHPSHSLRFWTSVWSVAKVLSLVRTIKANFEKWGSLGRRASCVPQPQLRCASSERDWRQAREERIREMETSSPNTLSRLGSYPSLGLSIIP